MPAELAAIRIAIASIALTLVGCAGMQRMDKHSPSAPAPAVPAPSANVFSTHAPMILAAQRAMGFPDPFTRALADAALNPLAEARKFSGAVILGRNGRIVHERSMGLAQRERGLPFTLDTAADGASLAKTFTAAAVHLLVAEGKLNLDDPVQRFLPEYPDATTTLRHLITHSNGLPDYEWFDPHFPKDSVRQSTDLLAVLAREKFKPAFTPGTRFVYGNVGFDMAGLVVERASGQPFAEFLRLRFLDPLGMKDSFARPARFADWPGTRTLAYHAPPKENELNDVFDGEGFIGASNLYFTARDLHRWVSAFAMGKGLPKSVFDAAALPVQIDGQQSGISAGNWFCDDSASRCYYTGSLNGFYSLAYWDRGTGDTVVYLSNSSFQGADTPKLDRLLVLAMALPDALVPGSASPLPNRPPASKENPAYIEITKATYVGLSGTYLATPQNVKLHIRQSDDGKRLTLQRESGLVYDLFKITPTLFYLPGLDAQIGFSGTPDAPALHLRSLLLDLDARRPPTR